MSETESAWDADEDPACNRPVERIYLGRRARAPKIKDDRTWIDATRHPLLTKDVKLDMCLTIGTDGSVRQARVVDGQGIYQAFHREARNAAMHWRFEPAMVGGQPVEWRHRTAVIFRLNQ